MPDVLFLAFLPDPFAVGRSAYGIFHPRLGFHRVEPAALKDLEFPVVTLDASALIEDLLRLNVQIPVEIVDAIEALRLLSGRSKKDGGEKFWLPWTRLRTEAEDRTALSRFREAFQSSAIMDPEQLGHVLEVTARALAGMWTKIVDDLRTHGEYDRFLRIEVPAAQIFYERQRSGIAIDQRKLITAHGSAKREKYQAYIQVAQQTQVSPTGMTFRNVDKYLGRTDAAYLQFAADYVSIEDYFRMAADFSVFAREFVRYVRADRDVAILSRLFGAERAHPRFHPHGTVTSRTLVSDPYLQQLRRKHREVVAPDKGFTLMYLDYRQFEPGILAGLSGDPALLAAYNSNDLYTALGQALFGEEQAHASRDLCKKMFLGFCYGMSKDHISTVVAGPQATVEEKAGMLARVNAFFGRYGALDEFKRGAEDGLAAAGFVETQLGNRRYRTSKGDLLPEERRWAISQTIQGNASLIFKEALLRLKQRFGGNATLLPMHDAVLMQFETGTARQGASEASDIMKRAFSHRLPHVKPKVSVERFAGTE
jgi:DNA polymerase I-like protein with 3'-5' exonuclease and polymerase domains